MGEYSASGLSQADVLALISANSALSFVQSGAPMLLSDLLTNYPAGPTYAGMYANVTNLFNGTSTSTAGGVREVLRCRQDITNGTYAWTVQREGYNTTASMTGGTLVAVPLITPPTIRLTGTLIGNITLSASATNAYVGLKQRFIQNSTLGLFVTTITGLIGSNITLLGNTVQDLEYTASGWAKAST